MIESMQEQFDQDQIDHDFELSKSMKQGIIHEVTSNLSDSKSREEFKKC